MAWPPASAGTWSVRHSFSGSQYPRPSNIYYLSDNEVIFGDPLGIAVYDAINGTATVIGSPDSPNDWSLGDTGNCSFTMFDGQLYVAVSSYSDSTESQKVFRYNDTPHSWTLVYLSDNAGVLGGHGFNIMTSTSHLIISSNSVEGLYIKKSASPALGNWSDLSTADVLGDYPTTYIINDSNQSFASISDVDSGYLGQFVTGFFNNIGTFVSTYVRMPGYHWDKVGSEYSVDGNTWVAPTITTAVPMNLRNYTKFMGFDDSANRLYFWDDTTNQWAATFDTLTVSGIQTPYAFVMSNGNPILGQYSGSTASFYERSVALDLAYLVPETQATGKRLWIYKSEGADWISRGVRVEE